LFALPVIIVKQALLLYVDLILDFAIKWYREYVYSV
jgi:hypothetical protein